MLVTISVVVCSGNFSGSVLITEVTGTLSVLTILVTNSVFSEVTCNVISSDNSDLTDVIIMSVTNNFSEFSDIVVTTG